MYANAIKLNKLDGKISNLARVKIELNHKITALRIKVSTATEDLERAFNNSLKNSNYYRDACRDRDKEIEVQFELQERRKNDKA